MMRLVSWVFAAATAVALADTVLGQASDQGIELFEREIRPLLINHCVRCHGPLKQKSELRLDSGAALLAGGARGPAIVPGDPETSVLIAAVRYGDEDLAMPPKGKLAGAEVEALTEWVRLGAPYPGKDGSEPAQAEERFDLAERSRHWAFQPLREADPSTAPSETIDGYVREGLARAGLGQAEEADRATLLRRLSFDLTGLPPRPEWLATGRNRPFEEVVDELLASPHYGERWTRHWLDLVRYAESRGHEFDYDIPNAYQYRDYVVRAFNLDVPYDRFVMEHVAGDLLQPPRFDPDTSANESVLGTGFWFLGPEVHSPVDIRADQTDRTANQVDVLSRAFLGLTVACARCHDHKFDALSSADFYALSGFALGGSYRQVRFETSANNAAVAQSLEALESEHAPEVRRALGVFLEGQALQVRELLGAASAVAFAPEPGREALPDDIDLLFDDFERGDYAPWTSTGTAFGSGPRAASDLPDYQDVRGFRGQRVVNSHNAQGGEDSPAADAHVGRLTSPAFVLQRDYIHFLISGGASEGTAVRLVIDGQVVAAASGANSNAMQHASFDVRAWRGQVARLVLVDEHSDSWGHIGIDHIVFSDRGDERALAVELWPRQAAQRARLIAEQAELHGLDPEAIAALAQELSTASEDSPLYPYAFLAATSQGLDDEDRARQFEYVFGALIARSETGARADGRVLFDCSAQGPPFWSADGFGFGRRPVQAGAVLLIGSQGDFDIAEKTAASWNPTWDVLETASDSQHEPGKIDWEQSGRLLRTQTVTLEGGRLFYLVRGAGHAFAVVDGHRMVEGPLHAETKLGFEVDGDGFAWIEHDLRPYAGHRVHIEFSPQRRTDRPSTFALARVLESPDRPPKYQPAELSPLLRPEVPTLPALAERYEQAFRAAARRLREGELLGSADATLLAWLERRSPARPQLPEAFLAERATLLERIQRVSHVAPAMLEGSGVDESVLIRGNPKTPGEAAARRYLEVFDGPQPLVTGPGSGRLELARRITDPTHPLLARVWVNRIWQHLFGRGIVASVDDFGRMGDEPSHPELLDYLARRLIEGGWSTKALIREMALSSTYRSSSRADAAAAKLDPNNVLLHSARRRRLEGEAIRDAILAVSGALDPSLYGAPVPIHLTEFTEGRGRPTESGPQDGDGRRSLYVAVRRNFVAPFFQVFDFPPPATTMGRRSASNVPAQALALLNDPFVLGQAERWAQRILETRDRSTEQRVGDMYRAALARSPDPVELAEAVAFVERRCTDDSTRADEPRAWADLCHVVFNLKEFVFLD